MKGIIFTTFSEMVIEKFGIATWESLLNNTVLSSEGSYTAGDTYPYEELVTLIVALATMQKQEVSHVLKAFGLYMFPVLAQKYPIFLKKPRGLFDFLMSVDKVIHVEVKKLYPDATLPSIQCQLLNPKMLVLLYQSPRKLCALGSGLIQGAAKHFGSPIRLEHHLCMHNNADHCRFEITLV